MQERKRTKTPTRNNNKQTQKSSHDKKLKTCHSIIPYNAVPHSSFFISLFNLWESLDSCKSTAGSKHWVPRYGINLTDN